MFGKTGKISFMLLLLASTAFAASPAWMGTALLAVVAAVMILAILYMIGYGFGVNELLILAKEEFYQLIAIIVLIALLAGTDNILNSISQTEELKGTSSTMQDAAILSINTTLTNLTDDLNLLKDMDNGIAKQASKSLSCSVAGVGYSVTGCGGFAMLSTPFSLVGSILGFATGELYAVLRLIQVSQAYALSLLLPLGIILRTFKVTRGAGGLLIGFAIATYILLPMGIIFIDKFGNAFQEHVASLPAGHPDKAYFEPPSTVDVSCDEGSTIPGVSDILGGELDTNEGKAVNAYFTLKNSIKSYLFIVLVKATLGPVIAVLMMISGIRVLTALMGAEIDVSALTRLV